MFGANKIQWKITVLFDTVEFCFVETVISTKVTKPQMLASIENVPTFYH